MAILTEKWFVQFWRIKMEDCPEQKYFVISKNNKRYKHIEDFYCGMSNTCPWGGFPDAWQFHAKGKAKIITGPLLKAANLPEEWDDSILKSKYVLVIDEEGNIIDNAE